MSFLDDNPDMNGTIFTEENLFFARRYLSETFARLDSRWLEKPGGPMGLQWNGGGRFPACYLIEFARIISLLQTNITAKSVKILYEKVQKLLRARSEVEFEETYTELRVADFLSARMSPIAMDPLVPEEYLNSPNRRPTPDFAVRLPSADVFFEVTTLYLGALLDWDKSMNELRNDLLRELMKKRRLRRSVTLEFPSVFQHKDLSTDQFSQIVYEITQQDNGMISINIGDYSANVLWEGFAHFNVPEEMTPGVAATVGGQLNPAIAVYHKLVVDDNITEQVLKSIRNTLNGKRKQFPYEHPYVLVIKIGDHRLVESGIGQLLVQRIWPNPDYAWIGGIAFFKPRTSFEKSTDLGPELWLNVNDNAHTLLPQELIDVFRR